MKKEAIKPLVGGIAIGAMALLIVVFWTGWVVTSTKAESQGEQMAAEAVVEALAPICVEQFTQDQNKAERLEALKEKSSYQRRVYVEEIGWATMPGVESSVRGVADACAKRILELE
jgi:hypothetical protein